MAVSNTLAVRPITSAVGAVVEGVDLRVPLTGEQTDFVRRALLDHGVIFLRDQDIGLPQFWAFMQNFGLPMKEESAGTDHDQPDDVRTADMSPSRHATAVWHADTTSLAQPPLATALRAVSLPALGGDTCWSSMYASWEALSGPMQRLLDGLTAVHTIQLTFDRMGDYAAGFEANYLPRHAREQVHPVVLTHPESGRKGLYINESFTSKIVELADTESAAVLAMLFRHIERPQFTMRWHWRANDIAFWDNRCVQHYAVPDYTSARVMQRIVLAGVKPGEPSALVPIGREPE